MLIVQVGGSREIERITVCEENIGKVSKNWKYFFSLANLIIENAVKLNVNNWTTWLLILPCTYKERLNCAKGLFSNWSDQ